MEKIIRSKNEKKDEILPQTTGNLHIFLIIKVGFLVWFENHKLQFDNETEFYNFLIYTRDTFYVYYHIFFFFENVKRSWDSI